MPVGNSLLPPFQHWEILPHHVLVFVAGHGLGHVLVHFVNELRAELDHLVHRAVLGELAILVAIYAIVFVLASVGIGAEDFIGERHSAALTEFHFVFHILRSKLLIAYLRLTLPPFFSVRHTFQPKQANARRLQ